MVKRTKQTKAAARPAALPKVWTRERAEAHIRSMGMHCRGPVIAERQATWEAHMRAGRLDAARSVVTRGVPAPDGSTVPCGYNFGETVIAYPFDGKEREAKCPKCGTINGWRSPVFAGLDESKRKPSTKAPKLLGSTRGR